MGEACVERSPTASYNRLPAVRMYVHGERQCEAGNSAAGIRCFKRAAALCWELGGEEWPSWADALYTSLLEADYAEAPVLSSVDPRCFQPALTIMAAGEEDMSLHVQAVASALRVRNFAVSCGRARSPKQLERTANSILLAHRIVPGVGPFCWSRDCSRAARFALSGTLPWVARAC